VKGNRRLHGNGLAALVVLTALALAALGCNLGAVQSTATPRPSPTSSVKPTVIIQSPTNNSEVALGQPLTVQATATHPSGVTRIELSVNNQQVDRKISQNPAGDQPFSVYLNYTPTTAGMFTLQVIAYRDSVASDPAQVTINVQAPVATQIRVVDQSCQARVEVSGLNFRQGPGQNYPPYQVLPLGTTINITGRLNDLSWFQGRYGNTTGWLNAGFITLTGSLCNSLPLAQPPASPVPTVTPTGTTPPPQAATATGTPGLPDLVILTLDGPLYIVLDANNTKTATYRVVVQNSGSSASSGFSVGLVLPDGTQRDIGTVPALAAGQQAVFQTDITFTAPGSVRMSAFADITQTVKESDKTNNLKTIDVVLVKPTPAP